MTTLSKEDVVRMVKESKIYDWFWLRDNNVQEIDAVQNLLTLARADLAAEIERLKATPPDQRQDLHCVVSDISAECRELRTALAAAEADNERLRKALNKILTTDWVSDRVRRTAKTALAKHSDDSALREMIAGVYEECAKGCRKEAVVIVVDGPEERAYNNAISDCELAIRALAEKAKA